MVPPTVYVLVVQVIATLATLALAVPVAFATVQFCDGAVGCVRTLTLYAEPEPTDPEKEKVVAFTATVRSLPPLFWSTSPEPDRSATLPPRVYVGAGPFASLQACNRNTAAITTATFGILSMLNFPLESCSVRCAARQHPNQITHASPAVMPRLSNETLKR